MNASAHLQYQSDWVDSTLFEKLYPFSRRTFFLWIEEGKLTPYRPSPRKTLVKRSEVDRLIEASKAENPVDRIVDETMRELGVGE